MHRHRPSVVVLQIGSNDVNGPHEDTEELARAILRFADSLVEEHGVGHVVVSQLFYRVDPVCGTVVVETAKFNDIISDVDRWLDILLDNSSCTTISVWHHHQFWSDQSLREHFLKDSVHFNDKGMLRYYYSMTRLLKSVVKTKSK